MKDLKNEYEQLVGLEVPDLWDRIEMGVDAFEQQKSTLEIEETKQSKTAETINTSESHKKVIAMRRKARINRYMPLVAAAAVMLFGIMVFVNTDDLRRGFSKNESTTTANDAAASSSMMAEESFYEEDMAAEEAAYEEAMATEDASSAEEAMVAEAPSNGIKATTSGSEVFKGRIYRGDEDEWIILRTEGEETLRLAVPEELEKQVQKCLDENIPVAVECEALEGEEYRLLQIAPLE